MALHWKMPATVVPSYRAELRESEQAREIGDLRAEWYHLERAHILGQRWPMEHNAVHWRMLKFGLRTKNTSEIIGQLPRLAFGGIKSFVGTVPLGNTGGANIPALKSLPLPDDLHRLLDKA